MTLIESLIFNQRSHHERLLMGDQGKVLTQRVEGPNWELGGFSHPQSQSRVCILLLLQGPQTHTMYW